MIKAIPCFECRSRIRDTAEKQFKRVASGDTKPNSWTLLDFGKYSELLLDFVTIELNKVLKSQFGIGRWFMLSEISNIMLIVSSISSVVEKYWQY